MPGYNPYEDPMVLQALQMQGTPYQGATPSYQQSLDMTQAAPTPQTMTDVAAPAPIAQSPVDVAVAPPQTPAGVDLAQVQQALQMTAEPAPAATPATEPAPAANQYDKSLYGRAFQSMDEMDRLAEDQATSAQAVGEAKAEGAQQQADVAAKTLEQMDARLKDSQSRADQYKKITDDSLAEYRAAREAARALPSPRDRSSSMQRTMGAVAIGLGSAADHFAMVGGMKSNHVEQIQSAIDTKIERDIQAQRDAITNARQGAQDILSELQLGRQIYGDTQQADLFAQNVLKDRAQAELGMIAASTSNKEIKAGILGVQANYKLQVQKEKQDLLRGMISKKLTGWDIQQMSQYMSKDQVKAVVQAEYGSVGKDGNSADAANSPTGDKGPDKRTKTNLGADTKESFEADVPGYKRTMAPEWYTNERTKEATDVSANTEGLLALSNHMADLFDKVKNAKTPQEAIEARTDYISVKEDYLSALSIANGQGVINAQDAERMKGAVPPPPPANWLEEWNQRGNTAWNGTEFSSRAIRAHTNSLVLKANAKLKTLGQVPVGSDTPAYKTPEVVVHPNNRRPASKPASKPKGFQPG